MMTDGSRPIRFVVTQDVQRPVKGREGGGKVKWIAITRLLPRHSWRGVKRGITSSRTTISPVSSSLPLFLLSLFLTSVAVTALHCTRGTFRRACVRGRNRISASSPTVPLNLISSECVFFPVYFLRRDFTKRSFAARTLTRLDVATRFLLRRSPTSLSPSFFLTTFLLCLAR